MVGNIVTYSGVPPSTLPAPDVAKVIEILKQQNEILKMALTSVVIVPEGTRIRKVERETDENGT